MRLEHSVLKAGKTKKVSGHPIAYEMIEGVWHVLSYDGPNTDERTGAIGFDIRTDED